MLLLVLAVQVIGSTRTRTLAKTAAEILTSHLTFSRLYNSFILFFILPECETLEVRFLKPHERINDLYFATIVLHQLSKRHFHALSSKDDDGKVARRLPRSHPCCLRSLLGHNHMIKTDSLQIKPTLPVTQLSVIRTNNIYNVKVK